MVAVSRYVLFGCCGCGPRRVVNYGSIFEEEYFVYACDDLFVVV